MAQPYVGEIRIFAGNFAPAGWMFCEGAHLPISEYETLFQLIGTTYGGDGESTFALPDLRGRVTVHAGSLDGLTVMHGEQAGVESVTLSAAQMPSHSHYQRASSDAASPAFTAATGVPGKTAGTNMYALLSGSEGVMMQNRGNPNGGGQPHDNMAPFLCLNHIISLFGIFPSQT